MAALLEDDMKKLAAVALMALGASPVFGAELTGKVVSVDAGDALTLLAQNGRIRVRLAEIDAPEARQSYGDKSRASLASLCLERMASVRPMGRAPDGAVLGRVECDGVMANDAQVERGMAWVDAKRRESRSASPLNYLEDQAQRSKQGLWSEASPLAPWLYRRTSRAR
jgi:endonuclease YncB( thermonuclease family)